jgi:RNA polymerase sigma-70 factor (ECF subfamily)
LVDLLAADAVFCGDGGGKATAIREPLYGRDQVAAFLLAIFARNLPLGMTAEPVVVNGGPGIVNRDSRGKVIGVLALEILDGVIQTVRSVVNPDKLQHLGSVSDFLRIRPKDEETS